MDWTSFQNLPTAEVASLVRAAGPQVCVFPVNGTRRWFTLTHLDDDVSQLSPAEYLDVTGRQHIAVYQTLFDHGVDTVLTPLFGPDLLERGEAYRQLARHGLVWFCESPECLAFYDRYQVRVRVYGDFQRYLPAQDSTQLTAAYAELALRTAHHCKARLFIGVCAHDAAETVADMGIRFHQEHGKAPTRAEVVAAYYGEYVAPADLFIGFADRPAVFDMPLVDVGHTDAYFTIAPSLFLSTPSLRAILYDHLYARPEVADASYDHVSVADWQALRAFYALNQTHVLGIGRRHPSGAFWTPVPQVVPQSGLGD
ncbi:MAG: diterpene synthase [Chloroflexi bacterium]|nr:diterpene synthase [Chloroflexota bacterium]MBU1750719.1 diterpene synthase [Chloroflexota bacterium]